jgi:hypothetical protein
MVSFPLRCRTCCIGDRKLQREGLNQYRLIYIYIYIYLYTLGPEGMQISPLAVVPWRIGTLWKLESCI